MLAAQLTSLRFDPLPVNQAWHVVEFYLDQARRCEGGFLYGFQSCRTVNDEFTDYARITLFGGDLID